MTNAPSHNTTVLVVEDDAAISDMTIALLELEGYAPAHAINGQAALDYLHTHPLPDCILIDVNMPVMDGRAFRQAQQDDPRLAAIPIVLLSAARDSEAVARELRVAAVLRKPYLPAELFDILHRVCDHPT